MQALALRDLVRLSQGQQSDPTRLIEPFNHLAIEISGIPSEINEHNDKHEVLAAAEIVADHPVPLVSH